MTVGAQLRTAVEAWLDDDPDERDRAELRALLNSGDGAELADRFAGRLTFGTAGLRGAVGAGPNRMNRAVVRAATAAVAGWLVDGGGTMDVVVGCDARHRSDEFADEVARVLAGAGIRVHLLPRPGPTPLLAFAVRHLGTGAGIMITASHNPAADNGYKLYLSDGAQVIPRPSGRWPRSRSRGLTTRSSSGTTTTWRRRTSTRSRAGRMGRRRRRPVRASRSSTRPCTGSQAT
jgi:phosphomannomutase